jgi:hypothetical protein
VRSRVVFEAVFLCCAVLVVVLGVERVCFVFVFVVLIACRRLYKMIIKASKTQTPQTNK